MRRLVYEKKSHTDGQSKEITYNEALDLLLTIYRDNDMTRDMLTIPNRIRLRYSEIVVKAVDDEYPIPIVAMAGYYNLLPDDVEYDDDGNRI